MTGQQAPAARFCGECGTALPAPGQRCAACGTAAARPVPAHPASPGDALLAALAAGDRGALEALLATPGGEAAANVIRLRAAGLASQREASAYFGAADQAAHEAALAAAVHTAREVLAAAEEEAGRRAARVKAAVAAERQAQDRARDAAEHHRTAAEAEELARGSASPQAQTEALMRASAALTVAGREQDAARAATAAREQAERDLAAARAAVSTARRGLAAAEDRAAHPGIAPHSEYTLMVDVERCLLAGDLSDGERALAAAAVATLARLSGADRAFIGEGRKQARDEAETAARTRPAVVGNGDGTGTAVLPIGHANPWAPR